MKPWISTTGCLKRNLSKRSATVPINFAQTDWTSLAVTFDQVNILCWTMDQAVRAAIKFNAAKIRYIPRGGGGTLYIFCIGLWCGEALDLLHIYRAEFSYILVQQWHVSLKKRANRQSPAIMITCQDKLLVEVTVSEKKNNNNHVHFSHCFLRGLAFLTLTQIQSKENALQICNFKWEWFAKISVIVKHVPLL